jgi:hypothetical protein
MGLNNGFRSRKKPDAVHSAGKGYTGLPLNALIVILRSDETRLRWLGTEHNIGNREVRTQPAGRVQGAAAAILVNSGGDRIGLNSEGGQLTRK